MRFVFRIYHLHFLMFQFWHVHHELIEAERNILGRSDEKLTSRAAYAGGNLGMKDGKVYVY